MMPTYDCRAKDRAPGAIYFPCPVRIMDSATGERIPNVFYASTNPVRLGRFVVDAEGNPLVSPQRKKRWVDKPDGSRRVEYFNDRLEQWETRPWVAVAKDTGELIARSEDL